MYNITVKTQTPGLRSRTRVPDVTLTPDNPHIMIAELIAHTVREQITAAADPRTLNAGVLRFESRDIDREITRALRAFEVRKFLIVVDGQQRFKLDEAVELHDDSTVAFIRLLPLVGG